MRLILAFGMILLAAALALGKDQPSGLPLSLLFAHAVRSQLFGVSNSDPLALGVAIVLVAAVAFVSAALAARRAAKVDPMVALRYE